MAIDGGTIAIGRVEPGEARVTAPNANRFVGGQRADRHIERPDRRAIRANMARNRMPLPVDVVVQDRSVAQPLLACAMLPVPAARFAERLESGVLWPPAAHQRRLPHGQGHPVGRAIEQQQVAPIGRERAEIVKAEEIRAILRCRRDHARADLANTRNPCLVLHHDLRLSPGPSAARPGRPPRAAPRSPVPACLRPCRGASAG